LKRILIALAAATTLAATVAPAGASTSYLSLQEAHAAALRKARSYESYVNNNSAGGQFIYHPLVSCKNGRLSPTLVACVDTWEYYSPRLSGDTVYFAQPVHVSLVGGRISITASAKPCLYDATTGSRSGNCSFLP
jgi:hypothetical protein